MSKDDERKYSSASHENARDQSAHEETQSDRDEEIAELQNEAHHQHVGIQKPPDLPPASPRRALIFVGIFLLILVLAGAFTVWQRMSHDQALASETERDIVPTVAVVKPAMEKPDQELVLPGSLQAYEESPIYARTSGYLVKWYKDIGSRIHKGELLAHIDTPEVDQELNQARAARQQIVAQLELARISAERWENLRKSDSVSAQEADQQTSGYKQAQANLAAADANVKRLEQLEGFKDVYAPFDGVLTRRNVDPGALINAGAGGLALFNVARVDPLRVYTSVPQAYSTAIKVGSNAIVTLQEYPGHKFTGKIVRTAEAIDPTTRTLLTEVDVPNKDAKLLPGSFGEVHFAVDSGVNKLTIPVNAMLFRAQGAQAAVVSPDNHVHLVSIGIGRDYGTTLEVLTGISPTDQVVLNPPDSLEDGETVHVSPEKQNQENGEGAPPTGPTQQEQKKQQKSDNDQKAGKKGGRS
ncbi:MAG TPA: efflux RND transporter periplasmic adaptor subunit [Candidatus Koribacter sp.]